MLWQICLLVAGSSFAKACTVECIRSCIDVKGSECLDTCLCTDKHFLQISLEEGIHYLIKKVSSEELSINAEASCDLECSRTCERLATGFGLISCHEYCGCQDFIFKVKVKWSQAQYQKQEGTLQVSLDSLSYESSAPLTDKATDVPEPSEGVASSLAQVPEATFENADESTPWSDTPTAEATLPRQPVDPSRATAADVLTTPTEVAPSMPVVPTDPQASCTTSPLASPDITVQVESAEGLSLDTSSVLPACQQSPTDSQELTTETPDDIPTQPNFLAPEALQPIFALSFIPEPLSEACDSQCSELCTQFRQGPGCVSSCLAKHCATSGTSSTWTLWVLTTILFSTACGIYWALHNLTKASVRSSGLQSELGQYYRLMD
jgi:hypothetical protein